MFWGWLKSLIQYSFYQVIAQAFVFVFGSFLLRAIDAFPPPYTVDKILVGGFHLIFFCRRVHLRHAEGAVARQLALHRPQR